MSRVSNAHHSSQQKVIYRADKLFHYLIEANLVRRTKKKGAAMHRKESPPCKSGKATGGAIAPPVLSVLTADPLA